MKKHPVFDFKEKLNPRLLCVKLWFKYLDIESFQICERLEMRRRGRGGSSPSPSPTPPPPPSPNCKLEAGVKEINSALCSAMFGLVLSDQAYREFQARQGGHEKVNPSSVFSSFPEMALLGMISFFETILGRLILKFEVSVLAKGYTFIHSFIHSQKKL